MVEIDDGVWDSFHFNLYDSWIYIFRTSFSTEKAQSRLFRVIFALSI